MQPVLIVLLIVLAAAAALFYANRSAWLSARGNAEFMKGNEEKAMAYLKKAASIPRAKPQHKNGYAYLLIKNGNPQEAERILAEAAPKAKPGVVRLHIQVNLATALWLQGRREEAVRLLEEVSNEHQNSTVYGNLGYFKLLLGNDPEGALAFNKEAYDFNSDDLTILDNLAQSFYMLGRYEEAAEWYAKVVAMEPKHAESYYFYARTLQKLGRTEDALEQARIAKDKPLALVTPIDRAALEALSVDIEKSGVIYN